MKTSTLTGLPLAVLKALEEYQYLTSSQMVKLGVSKSIKSLRDNALAKLKCRTRPYVECAKFEKIKKEEFFYALSEFGAKQLAKSINLSLNDVKYPKGGIQFGEYWHRKHAIDFHIMFKRWIDETVSEIDIYINDFELEHVSKGKFNSKTKVYIKNGYIIPDIITKFSTDDKERLVAVEIHNLTSTAQIMRQLDGHMVALDEGAVSRKFNHDKANFVLSIHNSEKTLEPVKRRFKKRAEYPSYRRSFIFNTCEQMEKDFSGWHFADDTEARIFPVDK